MIIWEPLWLSLRLATITTVVLLLLAVPLAVALTHGRWRGRALVESLIALPLVLPPTVLGFYALRLMSGDPGQIYARLTGHGLAFTFEGLVLVSVIYSLPFAIQPLQAAFAGVDRDLLEAARQMGANYWQTLWHVLLPLGRSGLLAAIVLTFTHTLGEFGVVLMAGGSIPGQTLTASIAIYDRVQALDYGSAHAIAAVLLVGSYALLLAVYTFNRRFLRVG